MVFKSLHLSCNIIYKGKKKSKSAKNRVKRDNTHQKSTFGASLVYALEVALLQTELYLLQEVNIFRDSCLPYSEREDSDTDGCGVMVKL